MGGSDKWLCGFVPGEHLHTNGNEAARLQGFLGQVARRCIASITPAVVWSRGQITPCARGLGEGKTGSQTAGRQPNNRSPQRGPKPKPLPADYAHHVTVTNCACLPQTMVRDWIEGHRRSDAMSAGFSRCWGDDRTRFSGGTPKIEHPTQTAQLGLACCPQPYGAASSDVPA